ncbi:hypothetical protein BDN67DRAFT_985587 [Paxillus ammoniavirescens]|nr:hypothetical protein BDN67DRAFT_985587 [Paxillus ammoniavirescens]
MVVVVVVAKEDNEQPADTISTAKPSSAVPAFRVGPPKDVKKSTSKVAKVGGQTDDVAGALLTKTTSKLLHMEAFEAQFTSPCLTPTVSPPAEKDCSRKRATLHQIHVDSLAFTTHEFGDEAQQEALQEDPHSHNQDDEQQVQDSEAQDSEAQYSEAQDEEQEEEDEAWGLELPHGCMGLVPGAGSKLGDSSPSSSDYSMSMHKARAAHAAAQHFNLPPSSPPPAASKSSNDNSGSWRNEVLKQTKVKKSHLNAQPTVDKGKSRVVNPEEVPHPKKRGNLSANALAEIREFADEIKAKALTLGVQYGKSSRDILVAAGFRVKPSHAKVNDANLFRSWYWATKEKPSGASRDDFNEIITNEYCLLMQDIPKDNLAARRDKMKEIYEWTENNTATASTNQTVKLVASRVDSAKTQFLGLAEAWSKLEDIEIVGVVMYVGHDPAGRQTSGVFGGSNVVRQFINNNSIDVCKHMDQYTAIFKVLRNGDGDRAAMPHNTDMTSLDMHCCLHESPRDRNHRVLGVMCREKFIEVLKIINANKTQEKANPAKMSWQKFLNLAFQYWIQVMNWPKYTPLPHPQFDVKSIKLNPLRRAVFPYLTRKLSSLYDDEKSDDTDLPLPNEVNITLLPEIQMEIWDEAKLQLAPHNPAISKWQKARGQEEIQQQELAATQPKKALKKSKATKSLKCPRVEETEDELGSQESFVDIFALHPSMRHFNSIPSIRRKGSPFCRPWVKTPIQTGLPSPLSTTHDPPPSGWSSMPILKMTGSPPNHQPPQPSQHGPPQWHRHASYSNDRAHKQFYTGRLGQYAGGSRDAVAGGDYEDPYSEEQGSDGMDDERGKYY